MPVDDERIINIETQLSHQEHLLSALNEALSDQQAQIANLELLCQSLVERIRSVSDSGSENSGDHEQPPHY